MHTLYLLHLSREDFVFVLGIADVHLADTLAIYPIKTDFDAAAQHVARGRNLKLTCTFLEVICPLYSHGPSGFLLIA